MEAFVTIMFCWLLFVIIRMSFRNINARDLPAVFPS